MDWRRPLGYVAQVTRQTASRPTRVVLCTKSAIPPSRFASRESRPPSSAARSDAPSSLCLTSPTDATGTKGASSQGFDGLGGILDAVKNTERERTQLRAALERIQALLADALA
jgi:hypothetical protein